MKQTLDDVLKLLKQCANISNIIYEDQEGTFNRVIKFTLDNKVFEIAWWVNAQYLKLNKVLVVPYHYVTLSDIYPHTSKMNLQFYRKGDSYPICVLKVEDYPCQ